MRKKLILPLLALSALTLVGIGCIKRSPSASLSPSISVSDQSISTDSQLIIDSASIGDDGWLVIHAKPDNQPEQIIGYTYLPKGDASKIKITINKTGLTPSVVAMLHYDRGEKGAFEFPGADGPVISDQQVIMQGFNIKNFDKAKEASSAPVNRKEFIITAKQWSFSPAVIKVKKGDLVVLKLKTVDVAHSYAIPEYNINTDINPGETATVEFTADKVGSFTSRCTIYCGVGHVGMTGTLVVEE